VTPRTASTVLVAERDAKVIAKEEIDPPCPGAPPEEEACQFHAKKIHQPVQELQTIPLTWPFVVWGLDILGPFPRAQGGYHYLYIIIDKFTKLVEVDPVCTILARSAVKFIRGLVCRFGVPNRIITDNGSQFTSGLFREYCASAGIKICFASVAYPRSNG
jgi:transposase InsO family protein